MTQGEVSDRSSVRVFAVLVVGGLVGVIAIVPYTLTVLAAVESSADEPPPPLWILLPLQITQGLVLVAAATALGLWLGPRVGLGAPLLRDLVRAVPGARVRLRALLVPSALFGVVVAGAIVLLDLWVFTPRLATPTNPIATVQPPAWQGLLAAIYGGVAEELMLRLGVMTFLVWLGARLTRTTEPGASVMWPAIVLTALLFGIGHLPLTAAIWPLTPLVIARALLLNGIGGLVFGWLYWKRGLLAAMLAHFTADIVVHVVIASMNH